MRKIGSLRPGYTASPEFLADGLVEWNSWFDAMNADPACQFSNPSFKYNVTGPGSQTGGNGYQVGPTAADWVGPRPTSIIAANLVFTDIVPNPVYIRLVPVTQRQWASLSVQQISASQVTNIFWYDPQFPNGVFNVFPPLTGNAIQLYQSGSLVPPANLAAAYAAPPGYEDMVIYGLAKRLYHMVDRDAIPRVAPYGVIAGQADLALDRVKAMNKPIPEMSADAPSGSRMHGGDGFYDSFVTWTGEPY